MAFVSAGWSSCVLNHLCWPKTKRVIDDTVRFPLFVRPSQCYPMTSFRSEKIFSRRKCRELLALVLRVYARSGPRIFHTKSKKLGVSLFVPFASLCRFPPVRESRPGILNTRQTHHTAEDSGLRLRRAPPSCSILARPLWHPFWVRAISFCFPGVSLRPTPGYSLASLQDAKCRRVFA